MAQPFAGLTGMVNPAFEPVVVLNAGLPEVSDLMTILSGKHLSEEDLELPIHAFIFKALRLACEDGFLGWAKALEKRWIKVELEAAYSLAASVLNLDLDRIQVEVGVAHGTGTAHYVDDMGVCLVLHDLFDRMSMEVLRVASKEAMLDASSTPGNSGITMIQSLTCALAADSFAAANPSDHVSTQLLLNLKLVGFASTANLTVAAGRRRAGSPSILPLPQDAILGDTLVAFHELSHVQMGRRSSGVENDTESVIAVTSLILKQITPFLPEARNIDAWLQDQSALTKPSFTTTLRETEADELAVLALTKASQHSISDLAEVAGLLFGIVMVGAARQIGVGAATGIMGQRSTEIKALAVFRYVAGALAVLTSSTSASELEEAYTEHEALIVSQTAGIIDMLASLEDLVSRGLQGQLPSAPPAHLSSILDRNAGWAEFTDSTTTVATSQVGKWAADTLLQVWKDYSKPYRGRFDGNDPYICLTGEVKNYE